MLVVDRVTPTHRRIRLVEGSPALPLLQSWCLLVGLGMLLACAWALVGTTGAAAAALLFSLAAAASFVASALVTTREG